MITYKPKDVKLDIEYLENALKNNFDGFGLSYHDGKELVVFTTMEFDKLKDEINKNMDKEMLIHQRKATVGGITLENCQPFRFKDGAYFHNGTVRSLAFEHSDKSDSYYLGDILSRVGLEDKAHVASLLGGNSKVAYMDNLGKAHILSGEWYTEGEILFSNFWYKNIVAVYGTLKQGFTNHHFLENQQFLGRGKTVDKFPMIDGALPYAFDKTGVGLNLEIELYAVDKECLKSLDILEGVEENHYFRKEIMCKMDYKKFKAWIYSPAIKMGI
ncbi:MAG: hypothetical protein GX282_02680 [Campylobacteraceae bacterium]|nr:hypothetical protein [Campylobacteraceae bacterium]